MMLGKQVEVSGMGINVNISIPTQQSSNESFELLKHHSISFLCVSLYLSSFFL